MEKLIQIEDLVAIAAHSQDVILFVHKKDIDNPKAYVIQVNFNYRKYKIDDVGVFLKFNIYDEITDPLIQKGYILRLKQMFSDNDILQILIDFSSKVIVDENDIIEKGKIAQVGEIHEWKGVKMQKTAQGWIPVKDGRQISKEDIQSETKESKPEEQKEEEQYTEEQLSDFAKKTSEQDLKNAASGGNEKLRIAAKKELERRNIEENFKEEQLKVNNVDKKKQLKVILESNPMKDDYHTGIRSEEDILTAEEAFKESIEEGESPTPDFSVNDMKKALKKGSIMIYSSYPIDKGVFVSPSKMEAQAYAGKKEVYSKEIKLDDIAWIDNLQGQFAPTKEIGEVSKKKGNDKE